MNYIFSTYANKIIGTTEENKNPISTIYGGNDGRLATQQEIDDYNLQQNTNNIKAYVGSHSLSVASLANMFFNAIDENTKTNQQKATWNTIKLHLMALQISAIEQKPFTVSNGLKEQFKNEYDTWNPTEKSLWNEIHNIMVIVDATSPFALIYTKETQ